MVKYVVAFLLILISFLEGLLWFLLAAQYSHSFQAQGKSQAQYICIQSRAKTSFITGKVRASQGLAEKQPCENVSNGKESKEVKSPRKKWNMNIPL